MPFVLQSLRSVQCCSDVTEDSWPESTRDLDCDHAEMSETAQSVQRSAVCVIEDQWEQGD